MKRVEKETYKIRLGKLGIAGLEQINLKGRREDLGFKYKPTFIALRKVQPWNKLPRKVLASPSLEILKGRRPSVRESLGIKKKKKGKKSMQMLLSVPLDSSKCFRF